MTLPYLEAKPRMDAVERESEARSYLPTNALAAILKPVFMQAATKQFEGQAQRDVTRAAALVLAYKQRHGAFPDSLALAVPQNFTDPFNGKPLGYRRDAKGFVIYSVGSKQDFNGGVRDEKFKAYHTCFWYPMPAYYTQPDSMPKSAQK